MSAPAVARERLAELDGSTIWCPQEGPQLDAMLSPADELLFGGSAGGGKTSLGVGMALTQHERTLFVRREATQLQPVVDEMEKLLGSRDGYNGSEKVWRLPGGRQVQFGGVPNLGDEGRFKGNPRDLLVLDEACDLLESQARFLMGWVRSTNPRQRCRTMLCTNPPQAAEGEWVIRWFAPWLDPTYPTPAKPGELRWAAMAQDEHGAWGEQWVSGPEPIRVAGEAKPIHPVSRTFIPSRVGDNVYFSGTTYERRLQALPEPLRSQMYLGDFTAGRKDDEYQVIPTDWVEAAMRRWKPADPQALQVTGVGVDPSRGGSDTGNDETTVAVRRGWHFDPILVLPARVARHGAHIAKAVLDVAGASAPIHVDMIGAGASTLDHLHSWVGKRARGVNVALASTEKDVTGYLRFRNLRAAMVWRMRDRLAPEATPKCALPRDQMLKADLCAPRYRRTAHGIQVESKDELRKRLGRSPDRGDAVMLAALRAPVMTDNQAGARA